MRQKARGGRGIMCKSLVVGLLAVMPSAWAGPQTTDPATRELIEKLLGRIDSLEKRVAELEKGSARVTTPAGPGSTGPGLANEAAHLSHDQAPVPEEAQP